MRWSQGLVKGLVNVKAAGRGRDHSRAITKGTVLLAYFQLHEDQWTKQDVVKRGEVPK